MKHRDETRDRRRMHSGIFAALWVACCGPQLALAQTPSRPSVRISQGTLVPLSAVSGTGYYGSATAHSTSIPGITRAVEIKALAKGLGSTQLTNDAYAQRV